MTDRIRADLIEVEKLNDVYLRIRTSPAILEEIRDFFTFTVEGAKHQPKFKLGIWDGKIRMCSEFGVMYVGLFMHLVKFAQERDYKVSGAKEFRHPHQVTEAELNEFIEDLSLGLVPYDYQRAAVLTAINQRRRILISPTASGKSLIIHLIARWCFDIEQQTGRLLVVVPTINLVRQLRSDLISYGTEPSTIKFIMGGESKIIGRETQIVISTWQSLVGMPKSWFAQFFGIIGDEAHTFKAKSLGLIMAKLIDCGLKIGTTGTLDNSKVNKLTLQGLFGPTLQVERTENLMRDGKVAQLKVRAVVLQYTDEERKAVSKMKYQEEIDWIVTHPRRLQFIVDMARSMKGNTLVMFQFVEKHGDPLYKALKALETPERPVYYVHGGIEGDERDPLRLIRAEQTNAIIVCSVGTFSVGVNIPNLHNAIAASPTKSMIRLLQSIGRILRLDASKETAVWYDISDDLSWKSKRNFTLDHFSERVKIYGQENFDLKIFTRKL